MSAPFGFAFADFHNHQLPLCGQLPFATFVSFVFSDPDFAPH